MKQTITITREFSDIVLPGKEQGGRMNLVVDPPNIHPFEVAQMFAEALRFYMGKMLQAEQEQLAMLRKQNPELFAKMTGAAPAPVPPGGGS